MSDSSVAALFPLPLTTFEKYMLSDDRPDYPMTFVIQMNFRGDMRCAEFESALDEALLRHPLLCALVDGTARGGSVWMPADGGKPTVAWDVPGAAIGGPRDERIDLNSEVGLRIGGRRGDGVAEVTLQFHHACCDGIGAMRFIGDLLAAYGLRTASADRLPTLRPCNPGALAGRGWYQARTLAPSSRSGGFGASVLDGIRWAVRRPVILRPRKTASSVTPAAIPFPGICRHTFDGPETERLRRTGARRRATVNDLLLRDLLQTLNLWNAGREPGYANRWLRIAIPVNLRIREDDCSSAANRVSYTFLTRQGSQCADRQSLLSGIRRETDPLTRRRRALLFLRAFQFMERIPGAILLYLGTNRCLATTVLSNLGDLDWRFGADFPRESGKIIAGNLILEDLFGAPPIRANTRAAFLISSYGGRLQVCLRCDPRAFAADEARRLLSLYVDCIKLTMGEATEP